MRPQVKHLAAVLVTFCLAALPLDSLRMGVAQSYASSANSLLLKESRLGRGGRLHLEADTEKHEGTMSQDAALILGTSRKKQIVVFGVNLRRDAYLPLALALLIPLCAPTRPRIRLGAAALAGALIFGLSLLSFRAIAAWYFLVHGAEHMIYLPNPTHIKIAKVLYKAILSQPNYRLALAAGVAASALWLLGYQPLAGKTQTPSPLGRALEWIKSRASKR